MVNLPNNETTYHEVKNKPLKLLIYGDTGSGKTYFAKDFESPLFLNTDGNTLDINREVIDLRKSVTIKTKNGTERETTKIETFQYWINYLCSNSGVEQLKEKNYKTVVIDNLPHIFEWAKEDMILKDPEAFKNKKGKNSWDDYKTLNEIVMPFLTKALDKLSINFNVILIDHVKTKEITFLDEKVDSLYPTLSETNARVLTSKLSAWGYVGITKRIENVINPSTGEKFPKKTYHRTLGISDNPKWYAKNRFGINDLTIPLDYKEFMKKINERRSVLNQQYASLKLDKKGE